MDYISNHDSIEKNILNGLKGNILDEQARNLANNVEWWNLKVYPQENFREYPICILGNGEPILLLHGFDSNFLEFRRLAPLLSKEYKVFIPDLFGFGFSPRPNSVEYGKETLIHHLEEILERITTSIKSPIGIIGASMGGAIAMELARKNPNKISKLLLLAPAGLTGKPMAVPAILDQLGVWFLSRNFVRKSLCKQAFANPQKSVGPKEEQIASIHLSVPGWGRSLAAFARSGGLAGCGTPLPSVPIHSIWGANDRIMKGIQKQESLSLLNPYFEEINNCGHLPHLDNPEFVAKRWNQKFPL